MTIVSEGYFASENQYSMFYLGLVVGRPGFDLRAHLNKNNIQSKASTGFNNRCKHFRSVDNIIDIEEKK